MKNEELINLFLVKLIELSSVTSENEKNVVIKTKKNNNEEKTNGEDTTTTSTKTTTVLQITLTVDDEEAAATNNNNNSHNQQQQLRDVTWTLKLNEDYKVFNVTKEVSSSLENVEFSNIPLIKIKSSVLTKLYQEELSPFTAYATGMVSVQGNRNVWLKLMDPARKAAKLVFPLLEKKFPYPTFSDVTFINPESPQWVKDEVSGRCQICSGRFTLTNRRHHCRLCGRVCCNDCSSHRLNGNRVCSPCYVITAPKPKLVEKLDGKRNGNHHLQDQEGGEEDWEKIDGRKDVFAESKTVLLAKLKELKDAEEAPIRCTQSKSESERILRSRAVRALMEVRGLKKDLNAMMLSFQSVKNAVLGDGGGKNGTAWWWVFYFGFVFVSFVYFWYESLLVVSDTASSSSSSRGGDGKKSLFYAFVCVSTLNMRVNRLAFFVTGVYLYLTLPYEMLSLIPFRFLENFVFTTNLFALLVMTVGLFISSLCYYYSRVIRIYLVAFNVIFAYQSAKVLSERVFKMSSLSTEQMYDRIDRQVAPYLCEEVIALRSVFVKFGQYIGARSDIVPASWSVVLSKLQDDMPVDSLQYIERVLIEEGFDFNADFDKTLFDFTPLASASIAQVHKAVFRGRAVALKIQHENVDVTMRNDMKYFRQIIRVVAWLNKRFEGVLQLLNAWETEMMKELNFENEFANLERARNKSMMCKRLKDVLVPKPIVATKKILVMEFLNGFKITDMEQLDIYGVDKEALLKRIVQAYSYQLYVDGFFNADPHAGNMMIHCDDVTGTCRLVLLDFGMCVTLESKVRLGYSKLVTALREMSVSSMATAIAEVGYQNSQSQFHPERDLQFFAFLLRDTGNRKQSREEAKTFNKLRDEQRASDKQVNPSLEGRYFKEFPDSLIFLFRTLGLLRGLCTTLNVPVSYLENMADHAQLSLLLESASVMENNNNQHDGGASFLGGDVKNNVEQKIRKLALGRLVGCMQISIRVGEHHAEDITLGSLGKNSSRVATNKSVFPLLDFTKIVTALCALSEVNVHDNDEVEKALNAPIIMKKITLKQVLSHSTCYGGVEDSIHPSSFGHQMLDYDECFNRVSRGIYEAKFDESKVKVAKNHCYAFGFEIDMALRQTERKPQEIAGKLKSMSENIYLGNVPSDRVDDMVQISHGFVREVKELMMLNGEEKSEPMGEFAGRVGLASSLPILPGRVAVDYAMVNSKAVQRAILPSFNGYSTCGDFADFAFTNLQSFKKPLMKQIMKVHAIEEKSVVYNREKKWGLGFEIRNNWLFYEGFGGSFFLHDPEKRIQIVVLVSDLQLSNSLSKQVVREILQHFKLPSPIEEEKL